VHILADPADRQTAAGPSAEIATSGDTHPVVIRRPLSASVKASLVTSRKGATGGSQPPGYSSSCPR
jgi:DNA-binding IscR family transcriptional regulator